MVVDGKGDTNDKSIWERQMVASARVADATEISLSLTTVKNVVRMFLTKTEGFFWRGKNKSASS